MKTCATAAILVAAAIVSGCAQVDGTATQAAPAGRDAIGRETVTYQGEIPCADCPGQQMTVTLFPDFTFRLRRTYLGVIGGKDGHHYDLGRWARAQDGGSNRLRLTGGTGGPRQFLIRGSDALRMLDTDGREIKSAFSYDLERLPKADPVAGPMRLRGMYVYMADAAVFDECLTGKRFPVRLERAHAVLERAYLATRRAPGEPVLVTFEGRFIEAAAEPGAPVREHVVVERFDRVWPGTSCTSRADGRASLLETYWRPVEIGGKPVAIRAGTREPHFVLSREGNVRGFTGCNNLMGAFVQAGNSFRFKGIAATRMACLPAGNDIEPRFLAALDATASIRIAGESLELRDRDGKVRMRLEAQYFR